MTIRKGALLATVVLAVVLLSLSSTGHILALVGLNAVVLLFLVRRYTGPGGTDIGAPALTFAALAGLGFVLQPLYVLTLGRNYLHLGQWEVYLGADGEYLRRGLFVSVLGILGFAFGDAFRQESAPPRPGFVRSQSFYLWIWFVTVLVSVAIAGSKVMSSGSVSNYFNSIGQRQLVFQGEGYLHLFLGLPTMAYGFYVSSVLDSKFSMRSASAVKVLLLLLVTSGLSILGGGRAQVLESWFLTVVVYHYRVRRISVQKAIVLVVVALLVLVGLRVWLRDSRYGATPTEFSVAYQESLQNLPEFLFENYEVPFVQNMVVLTSEFPESQSYLLGKPWLAVPTWPIPRRLFPEKPRGSNAVFTSTFWPTKWENDQSEFALSGFGDFFINFGYLGVFLGMTGLGWLTRRVYVRWLHLVRLGPPLPEQTVFQAYLLWTLFKFLRGDLFNSSTFFITFLAFSFLVSIAAQITHTKTKMT